MKNINQDFLINELGFWKSSMLRITKPSWFFVTSDFVPSNQAYFLKHEGWKIRWVFKYLKRKFFMKLALQERLIVDAIPRNTKRILWINLSATSLGDSIMDLSGRVLLEEFEVDLLTDVKNYGLYQNDMFFKKVFHRVIDARSAHLYHAYDLIIIDAFSPKIISIKKEIAPLTPFLGMWSYLNGFETHRTVFSFVRIEWLLGHHSSKGQPILPILAISNFYEISNKSNKPLVAFVVGAEWKFRHYDKWSAVISELKNDYQVVLIGSSNGVQEAAEIISIFPDCLNFVGICSLSETVSIISQAKVIFAADGGLWHVACALNKPTIALFAAMPLFNDSGMRVNRDTKAMVCETLYDDVQVSNIAPSEIHLAFMRLLKRLSKC